jgi:hypothetical protein
MSDAKDEKRGEDERSGDEIDETGADGAERQAKDELFEAIDHFKNAASILFGRAASDPAVKSAKKEAGRIAKKIGDAAEPLAKQLTTEISRLTKDVMETVEGAVEGATQRKPKPKSKKPKAKPASDEEE